MKISKIKERLPQWNVVGQCCHEWGGAQHGFSFKKGLVTQLLGEWSADSLWLTTHPRPASTTESCLSQGHGRTILRWPIFNDWSILAQCWTTLKDCFSLGHPCGVN